MAPNEFPGLIRLIEERLDRELLRPESITWHPNTWLRRFPSTSPAARYMGELEGNSLNRDQILEIARQLPALSGAERTNLLERTFLLSQIWGFGTVGYGAYRTSKAMDAAQFPAALEHVYDLLAESGPAAAYDSMRPGAPNHLAGLGPAFATKFLYFAGYNSAPPKGAPSLILDSLVGAALHLGEPSVFGPRTGRFWDRGAYSMYVTAARWIMGNSTRYALHPDDTERALFAIGKELRNPQRPS
ncbi:MAG: hypothetical protein U1E29_00080 [Coriobacteriia bacterium]|nr:hypothetical protein [Coriobacteriia bacterium]